MAGLCCLGLLFRWIPKNNPKFPDHLLSIPGPGIATSKHEKHSLAQDQRWMTAWGDGTSESDGRLIHIASPKPRHSQPSLGASTRSARVPSLVSLSTCDWDREKAACHSELRVFL